LRHVPLTSVNFKDFFQTSLSVWDHTFSMYAFGGRVVNLRSILRTAGGK
jgi:hypothetical protein